MIWVALAAVAIVGCLYEPPEPIEEILRWAINAAPAWDDDNWGPLS